MTGDLNYISGSAADIKMDTPLQATLHASFQVASAEQIKYVYGLSAPYADGLWFQGLPSANSGFGNHLATLKAEGHDSHQARLQAFF